jgi:hypothetical protein
MGFRVPKGSHVQVTDLEVAILRAHILGDGTTADHRLNEQLAATGEADALSSLLWAAFAIAVRRYFAGQGPMPLTLCVAVTSAVLLIINYLAETAAWAGAARKFDQDGLTAGDLTSK